MDAEVVVVGVELNLAAQVGVEVFLVVCHIVVADASVPIVPPLPLGHKAFTLEGIQGGGNALRTSSENPGQPWLDLQLLRYQYLLKFQ